MRLIGCALVLLGGCETQVKTTPTPAPFSIQAAVEDLRFSQPVERIVCEKNKIILWTGDKRVGVVERNGAEIVSAHAFVSNVDIGGEQYDQMMWTTGVDDPKECVIEANSVTCQNIRRIPRRDPLPMFGAAKIPIECATESQ